MLKTRLLTTVVFGIALAAGAGTASAQGIKRMPLQDVKFAAGYPIVT
jgi:hypothetical protein